MASALTSLTGAGATALSGAPRIPSDAAAPTLGVCEAEARERSVPSPPILTPVPSPLAHAGLRGSAAEADGADSVVAALAVREGYPLAEDAAPTDDGAPADSPADVPRAALSGEGVVLLCDGLVGDGLTVARADLSGEVLAALPIAAPTVPSREGAAVPDAGAAGREIGASVALGAGDTSTHTPSRYS